MSSSDAESLRAYMEALVEFLVVAGVAADFAPKWRMMLDLVQGQDYADVLAVARMSRDAALLAIRERRKAALVAGVNAGETIAHMRGFLKSSWSVCNEYPSALDVDSPTDPTLLAEQIFPYMTELFDLIALVEAKIPESGKPSRPSGPPSKSTPRKELTPLQKTAKRLREESLSDGTQRSFGQVADELNKLGLTKRKGEPHDYDSAKSAFHCAMAKEQSGDSDAQ